VATSRYFDPSQPQTLQIATMLLYFEAAIGLIYLLTGAQVLSPLFIAAYAAGAYGMANEKKWGYRLATIAACVRLGFIVLYLIGLRGALGFLLLPTGALIELIIAVALAALLLHEQSREYQRIWFS
jgi:hypothetical protein